jgi:hypothetical protein
VSQEIETLVCCCNALQIKCFGRRDDSGVAEAEVDVIKPPANCAERSPFSLEHVGASPTNPQPVPTLVFAELGSDNVFVSGHWV